MNGKPPRDDAATTKPRRDHREIVIVGDSGVGKTALLIRLLNREFEPGEEDGRSLANWLERLIEAEVARQQGSKGVANKKPKLERRETAMNVRVRESVKATAERLAKAEAARSPIGSNA
jgi:GTPase SAR1 family protein